MQYAEQIRALRRNGMFKEAAEAPGCEYAVLRIIAFSGTAPFYHSCCF